MAKTDRPRRFLSESTLTTNLVKRENQKEREVSDQAPIHHRQKIKTRTSLQYPDTNRLATPRPGCLPPPQTLAEPSEQLFHLTSLRRLSRKMASPRSNFHFFLPRLLFNVASFLEDRYPGYREHTRAQPSIIRPCPRFSRFSSRASRDRCLLVYPL